MRVESLENTTADHDTRLSATEADIEGNSVHSLKEKKPNIYQENATKLNAEIFYDARFRS